MPVRCGLFSSDGEAVNADCRRCDCAAEFQVAGDFGNVKEHAFQITGDRDFFDRIRQFAARYPKTGGAARVVSGDEVYSHTQELGDIQPFFHVGDKLSGRSRAGLQEIVARTNAGSSGEPTRGVRSRLKPELLGRVSIQQIRTEHPIFNNHGAAGGNAFSVKRTGAEATDDSSVVDDIHVRGGNLLTKSPR